MNDDAVEIIEEYEANMLVRKTANGIPLPLNDPNLPTIVIQRILMTKEEVKRIYGKEL